MNTGKNSVLQLFPPKIDLQTRDIIGALIGVPLHAIIIYPPELVFKRARVSIDPPLAGTVEEHDDVRLWATLDPARVGPVAVAGLPGSTRAPWLLDATTITDVNAPIEMHTKESQFLIDVVVYMFYTIERNSQNLGTSPPLSYIYNRIRPGMKDDLTVPGGHSELKLLLPDEIKNGVGPGFTTAKVAVQYPYARAYDRISFMCNGKILEVTVSPTEAPEPPDHGSETPTTVYFDVDRAFLKLAQREDQTLAFLFTVYDQLNNSADPDAQWSPPQIVDEDLDGKRLAKPLLREQLNDPGDTPEIDLGKLLDKPLLTIIVPTDIRFVTGYKVTTFYTATHPDHPDVFDEQSRTVMEDEFGQKQLIVIEVPNHKVSIPGRTVSVFHELRKPDNTDGSPGALVGISNTATALVVGTALELKPPSVLQATGSTLAPLSALTRLTVVVPAGTTLPTDLLNVIWTAAPGTHAEGSYTSTPRPIGEIGLNIDIPPALLAFCLGASVTVSYSLIRGGNPVPSQTFTLNVQDLPQTALIAPRLKEAANGGEGAELNLLELTAEGKMWCPGAPLLAERQPVWMLFKGTNANDTPYERYFWDGSFAYVNAAWVRDGFFEATAPYQDLKGLKDGSSLTVEMFVGFGKSQDIGLAKRFLVRSYSVRAVEDVAPTITSVIGYPSGVDIPQNSSTEDTAVTLNGTAAKGQKVEIYDSTLPKGRADVDELTGKWTYPVLSLSATEHSFAAKALYGTEQVSHPPRMFNVREGLDDLTTFTDFNWNGWYSPGNTAGTTKITQSGGEFYVVATVPIGGVYKGIHLAKNFSNLEIGETYTLSFSYQGAETVLFDLYPHIYNLFLPASNVWRKHKIPFLMLPNSNPYFIIKILIANNLWATLKLDNLHLMKGYNTGIADQNN